MHQRFSTETRAFITEMMEISYWSRGAVEYHNAYDLTPIERDMWSEWLKNRVEVERKNSPYPCY